MKIRKSACVAGLATVLGALALNAQAQDPMSAKKPDKSAFEQIDVNKDGVISTQEANAKNSWLASNFNTVDTNRDGRVSKAEFDKAVS